MTEDSNPYRPPDSKPVYIAPPERRAWKTFAHIILTLLGTTFAGALISLLFLLLLKSMVELQPNELGNISRMYFGIGTTIGTVIGLVWLVYRFVRTRTHQQIRRMKRRTTKR